jgi:uncharacterized protein YcgL (UPF0745 family)
MLKRAMLIYSDTNTLCQMAITSVKQNGSSVYLNAIRKKENVTEVPRRWRNEFGKPPPTHVTTVR